MKSYRKQLIWIAFGLLTLLLSRLTAAFPYFVEHVYSRGIFVGFRVIWDHSLALLPIPLIYVLVLGILLWSIQKIRLRLRIKQAWFAAWKKHTLNLLAGILGIIALFYWLWGFNYNRIALTEQLQLERQEADQSFLQAEVVDLIQQMDSIRGQISLADSNALGKKHLPQALERKVRSSLTTALIQINYPTYGRVRIRNIHPKGWLRGMGASGIYIPFVGEGHVDASMPPLQHPAIMAHEMSHGYGFTDEGVCNFLALLACEQSEDPMIQYSGLLMYFRYASHDLFRMNPAAYRSIMPMLSKGIQADLAAIRANREQYPGWFPNFSRVVYNSYLKSQGVAAGFKSYNQVVGLYLAWKQKNK